MVWLEKDIRSSYVGFVVDDLVSTGDEGRGKQRYASGSRKQALIRRFPNGETPCGLYCKTAH